MEVGEYKAVDVRIRRLTYSEIGQTCRNIGRVLDGSQCSAPDRGWRSIWRLKRCGRAAAVKRQLRSTRRFWVERVVTIAS